MKHAKVCLQKYLTVRSEVPHVQPFVRYRLQFVDQIFTFNVTDETVLVREAQAKTVAKFWQEAVVI